MTTSDVSFQFGDGPVFSATHVSVGWAGSEIVSSFVFDDGLVRDPCGMAVVATKGTADTLPLLLATLKARSPAFRSAVDRAQTSLPAPPRPYVAVREPMRMVFVAAQVLEDHEAVYLAFALVDPHNALQPDSATGMVPAQRVPAPRVTISISTFLAWVSGVTALAEEGPR